MRVQNLLPAEHVVLRAAASAAAASAAMAATSPGAWRHALPSRCMDSATVSGAVRGFMDYSAN